MKEFLKVVIRKERKYISWIARKSITKSCL